MPSALLTALCEYHMTEMTTLLIGEIAGLRARPLDEAIRPLVKALLRAHAVAPALHRVFIEQVPRINGLERVQQLDRMLIEVMRAELERRPEKLRPRDLEMAVFILVHSVQAVTHAAILERPDALSDDALADEISALVLRYLLADPP